MPTEQEVTSFLDEYCEVARSTVETRLAARRSAAASSLVINEYDLDKKFAINCVEERIKTMQDKALLSHQQMQGIQQGAEFAVQSARASAAGAATAAEARRTQGALVPPRQRPCPLPPAWPIAVSCASRRTRARLWGWDRHA